MSALGSDNSFGFDDGPENADVRHPEGLREQLDGLKEQLGELKDRLEGMADRIGEVKERIEDIRGEQEKHGCRALCLSVISFLLGLMIDFYKG
ncbi:hypothetical protein [Streptomyces niveus]|uniref:hypothetical protein n=1 Tax=Streptomyces niveus TaxID=193462 RepID=UPI0036836D64